MSRSIIKNTPRQLSQQAVALAAITFLAILASVFIGIGYGLHRLFGV
jgi:hypothetical protein